MARQLLRYGADIDYLSARGWSVISYLWEHGNPLPNSSEFFEMCKAQSFDAYNAQDRAGWTCLHRAAAYGTANDIRTLLGLGASMSMCTRGAAWTPIHVAAAMNNDKTLDALAGNATNRVLHSLDANGWTPLHIAVERGAEKTMTYLLMREADPHATSNITANWFPPGLEDKSLTPEDLARDRGMDFLFKYQAALGDADFDITLIDDDIFWEASEVDDVDTAD
jgi:ankyrin repeat protein